MLVARKVAQLVGSIGNVSPPRTGPSESRGQGTEIRCFGRLDGVVNLLNKGREDGGGDDGDDGEDPDHFNQRERAMGAPWPWASECAFPGCHDVRLVSKAEEMERQEASLGHVGGDALDRSPVLV